MLFRSSRRNGDNNLFSNHQRNYPRNQNFYDYQSRDQNNGYIRHTTTRGREDNHLIEIRPMVATDLKEGRTEIAVEIITTILRTPLFEIAGDHPENCCFDWMIVLPVPSCGVPNDQIRRCNHCFDHVTGSHQNSDYED